MDVQRERRDMLNGFGDGLVAAFEFAVTPVVFGGIGLFLDHRFGLTPVLTIALLVLALIAKFVVLWSAYDQKMKAEEAKAPWRSTPPRRLPSIVELESDGSVPSDLGAPS